MIKLPKSVAGYLEYLVNDGSYDLGGSANPFSYQYIYEITKWVPELPTDEIASWFFDNTPKENDIRQYKIRQAWVKGYQIVETRYVVSFKEPNEADPYYFIGWWVSNPLIPNGVQDKRYSAVIVFEGLEGQERAQKLAKYIDGQVEILW